MRGDYQRIPIGTQFCDTAPRLNRHRQIISSTRRISAWPTLITLMACCSVGIIEG
jgi:hypothetical protein